MIFQRLGRKLKSTIKEYPISFVCFVTGTFILLWFVTQPYLVDFPNWINVYLIKIYNVPENHNINFSLGEAISALGLIFAVMQLLDKRRKLTLKIRGGLASNLWGIFVVFGLFSVLMASLTSQNNNSFSLFNSSLFWEQIGFFSFVLSPFSLWWTANDYVHLFKPNTAKRFYHLILQTVSTGRLDDLEIVTTLLLANLDELTDAINLIETLPPNDSLPKKNVYCGYAQELLNAVLSDKQIADYIVTSRIDFLFTFLGLIKKKRLSRRTIGTGFNKLMAELFENPESYLYKQLSYDGLSLYAPIYETIFGDTFFINEFIVLKMWSWGLTDINKNTEKRVSVFLKAMEEALKASKFQDTDACQEIAFMLHQLVEYAQSLMWQSQKNSNELNPAVGKIEYFFGNTFLEKYKSASENGTVSDYELKAGKGDMYHQSLTASYSLALVELVGEMTRTDNREFERDRAMNATRQIISISNIDSAFDNIHKCVLDNMWEKIKENVEGGWFPATLRIYIELMEWTDKNLSQQYYDERTKLINYLYKEVAPRIIKNETMANRKDKKEDELLPNNITFDRNNGTFFVTYTDGVKKELE